MFTSNPNWFDSIEKIWDQVFWGNSVRDWSTALVTMVATFLILYVARGLTVRRLSVFAQKTQTEADNFIVELVKRTRSFFFLGLAMYFGSRVLELSESANKVWRGFIVLTALLQAALWCNALVTLGVKHYTKQRLAQDAASVTTIAALGFLIRIVLWSIIALLALDNLGVNVTTLVAGLGIGGIAIALAAQSVLGDLFASLAIVLDKPFVLNDEVIVGEFRGRIEHIGLKTTRLRSWSGEELVFTNSDLLQSRIRNLQRMRERRVAFVLGVTYQTPYDKLARLPELLKEIVLAQPLVRFEHAHFKAYGSFALEFEIIYYVLRPEANSAADVQQLINFAIFKRFQEEQIEFAYPTQTVYLQPNVSTANLLSKENEVKAGAAA
ncbi:mechanosensitive ion channel family protein [candidate division KSB1 bacterium]|nr:mechanosensitive ion channel family protein [candidate division KSB1 bacterium]